MEFDLQGSAPEGAVGNAAFTVCLKAYLIRVSLIWISLMRIIIDANLICLRLTG
jgi:hypothetical protein